jgi:molybdopterin molybdotransferase
VITVEEALERILGYVEVLEAEERPLLGALGQVLAEDVASGFNIPPLDNTAMDGYAVRATPRARRRLAGYPARPARSAAGYVSRGRGDRWHGRPDHDGAPVLKRERTP